MPSMAAGSLRRMQRGQKALGGSPELGAGGSLFTLGSTVARAFRKVAWGTFA